MHTRIDTCIVIEYIYEYLLGFCFDYKKLMNGAARALPGILEMADLSKFFPGLKPAAASASATPALVTPSKFNDLIRFPTPLVPSSLIPPLPIP